MRRMNFHSVTAELAKAFHLSFFLLQTPSVVVTAVLVGGKPQITVNQAVSWPLNRA